MQNKHKYYNLFHLLFAVVVSVLFLPACNTTKYLSKDESLLVGNSSKIINSKNLENKIQSDQELSTLYKQNPNGRILLIKREWLHFKLQRQKNKNSWFYKTLLKYAEKPAILDTLLIAATEKNMQFYFFNKGFFNIKVSREITTRKKKSKVTYIIDRGSQYVINEVSFEAEDSNVAVLLNAHANETLLKKGSAVESSLFQGEKARIADLMFNNGYAEFNPVYIQALEADTIGVKTNIRIKILNPDQKSFHNKYKISSVNIFTEYLVSIDSNEYQKVIIDSVTFYNKSSPSILKENAIQRRIHFRSGDIYNKSNLSKSYVRLAQLGFYRFISFDTKLDSAQDKMININVLLTPNKKWVFDAGIDFSYTTLRSVSINLFGLSAFVNLKNRNLFRGAEVFNTKFEVGTELNLVKISDYNSINITYDNELILPDFYDISGSLSLIANTNNKFRKKKINLQESKTNLSAGIDYVTLTNYYQYVSLNASVGYDYQPRRGNRITIGTVGFNLYLPKTEAAFDSIIKDNLFLEKSFKGKFLFTSFFLNKLAYYNENSRGRLKKTFIGAMETSGLEISLINSIYNTVAKRKDTFSLKDIEFSKFIKFDLDQRFEWVINSHSSFVHRITGGIAFPFGGSGAVPYIRQFYLGGPQSLRAWNTREVGPGSDEISKNIRSNGAFYSAGDIKLEANIEYRFDIIWRLKGALFVDAGNIWLLPKKNQDNPKPHFSNRFYQQIAVGTGIGVRLDLSYFIFRLDMGFKLRNPYRDENGSHWIYSTSNPLVFPNLFKNSNIHLALNYPF
ncbi:MAG: BamA/TamA family outer membrane protein [Bacteroidota bacterium]|nr:BamA/TamA family outer membrane protein [Bacteroidota bacterium]